MADLARRFPKARFSTNDLVVRDDLAKVVRFVDHPAEGLYLSLDLRSTYFQRLVGERLQPDLTPVDAWSALGHNLGYLNRSVYDRKPLLDFLLIFIAASSSAFEPFAWPSIFKPDIGKVYSRGNAPMRLGRA